MYSTECLHAAVHAPASGNSARSGTWCSRAIPSAAPRQSASAPDHGTACTGRLLSPHAGNHYESTGRRSVARPARDRSRPMGCPRRDNNRTPRWADRSKSSNPERAQCTPPSRCHPSYAGGACRRTRPRQYPNRPSSTAWYAAPAPTALAADRPPTWRRTDGGW